MRNLIPPGHPSAVTDLERFGLRVSFLFCVRQMVYRLTLNVNAAPLNPKSHTLNTTLNPKTLNPKPLNLKSKTGRIPASTGTLNTNATLGLCIVISSYMPYMKSGGVLRVGVVI